MPLEHVIPVLQVAIGPMILVSGVGLILLSMTNRFGRIIDRAREMTQGRRENGSAQLHILLRRAAILRGAITLAVLSALLAAVMIIVLFVGTVLHMPVVALVVTLFIACMLSLILSLLLFIADLNLSLAALKLEVNAVQPQRGQK